MMGGVRIHDICWTLAIPPTPLEVAHDFEGIRHRIVCSKLFSAKSDISTCFQSYLEGFWVGSEGSGNGLGAILEPFWTSHEHPESAKVNIWVTEVTQKSFLKDVSDDIMVCRGYSRVPRLPVPPPLSPAG